jgi:uncharacterized CHY-type Zn-finger protein
MGFEKIYALKGGYMEWVKAGFPTEQKPALELTCIRCHAEITPRIVADWQQSKHPESGVVCSVCHGDQHTSESDVEKAVIPSVDSCMRCHEPRLYPNIKAWGEEFRRSHNPKVR